MEFLEILTIELGSSIAKAILKLWLKDTAIASDVSSSLIDLIKAKTQDITAQQHAKRQFEEIGEKVAQNLLPLYQAEYPNVSDSSKEAILLQVTQILNNSRIDAQLLAEKDLDGGELLSYLKKLNPHGTRDFSFEEESLFNRTLSDTCQNIVDVASQLPSFSEQTLGEILRRENLLIRIVNQILDEVRRIRAFSVSENSEDQQPSQFEVEYRRAVVRNLDEVELFGANVSRASRRHRLSVAYITLDVKRISKTNQSEEDNITELVYKALRESTRLLLKGDAGSGKTTLLKWIAVKSASGSFIGELDEFNSYVPFFIRLRDFTDKELPSPRDFPILITRTIEELLPIKWTSERLKSGKAFILIDGLDEIPAKKREDVEKWLIDLLKAFPSVRYIISSRPTAVPEEWKSFENFHEAYLQPMSENSVSNFIDHWHAAVQDAVEEFTEKQELPSLALHLKNSLRENVQLLSLARTPLLCALICALHRERRTQLPKDRIQLYGACTEMLLERREKESGINYRGDYPELSFRHKEALIKDCAYWFIKNGWSSVEVSDLDHHISNRLLNMENLDASIKAPDVRRYFVERSGILREPTKGYIDFAHKTFQEFLAAKEILDLGDIGILISNALNSLWTDVVVLAAGLAPQKTSDLIITSLIREGENLRRGYSGNSGSKKSSKRGKHNKRTRYITKGDRNNEYRYYLLAASCLETIVSLSPHVKQAVQKKLGILTPPISTEETKKWAASGEIAIPYLVRFARDVLMGAELDKNTPPENTQNIMLAIESIRALTMMHQNKYAIDAIKSFTADKRKNVLNVIVDGWGNFNREEYARLILSENKEFGEFIYDVPNMEGLQHLPYLEKVRIKKGLIENLNGLENLDLRYFSMIDCNKVKDVGALRSQENLKILAIINCPAITDMSIIRSHNNLELLDMSLCAGVHDLSPLKGLESLRYLGLYGCDNISDFSFLLDLPNLGLLGVSFELPEKEAEFKQIAKSLEDVSVLMYSKNVLQSWEDLGRNIAASGYMNELLSSQNVGSITYDDYINRLLQIELVKKDYSLLRKTPDSERDTLFKDILRSESALQKLSYVDKNILNKMTPEQISYLYRILTANRYGIYSEPGFQMKEFAVKCMEMVDNLTPKIKDLVLLYAKDISETYEQRNFMFSSLVTHTEYIKFLNDSDAIAS